MKKLDVYVARAYILRFIMAHLVILGLYMSFDIMQRIDMLQQADVRGAISQLFVFYLYQMPSNVMHTVPPLLMLSAGLVFVHMNRNGELLTLKACGISLRRTAVPIFAVTLSVIALLAWAQERVIPDLYRQRNLLENKMEGRVSGPFLLIDESHGYELYVPNYDFKNAVMTLPTLMIPHSDSPVPRRILDADSAVWADENLLEFRRVSIQNYDPRGRPVGEAEAFESKEWPTSLTVVHFADARDNNLTTRAPAMTLASLSREIKGSSPDPTFRVLYHTRIADKLTSVVLLLIGIPLLVGYGRSPHSRLAGALVAMLVMGIYYMLSFVTLSFGNAGAVNPVLAAWSMPIAGLMTGIVLFYNMRT